MKRFVKNFCMEFFIMLIFGLIGIVFLLPWFLLLYFIWFPAIAALGAE